MKHLILYVAVILSICSCDGTSTLSTSSFQQLLPDTSTTKYDYYNAAINLNNELNLNRINKGVDSFEFRMWTGGMMDLSRLYIIKYVDNNWFATVTDYWQRAPERGEKGYTNQKYPYQALNTIVDSSYTYRVVPAISFSNILDTLTHYQLNAIPSQKDIPDFVDGIADGFSYSIELSTKHYYKLMSYHSPNLQHDKFGYNAQVTEFLKFIERTFKEHLYLE
jgi:hypothetical protein